MKNYEFLGTPGPWRWEVNLRNKRIQLCGGKPAYDLTVMDFERWGMQSAKPRVLKPKAHSSLMILEDFTAYIQPKEGREHHEDWFQVVKHPDMNLIEASPLLLELVIKAMKLTNNEEFLEEADKLLTEIL